MFINLLERLMVWLHYRNKTDLYQLCRKHRQELFKRPYIDPSIRWQVWQRDHFTCHYCGIQGVPLTLDHVVPVKYGGETTLDNLWTSCQKCNSKKGSIGYQEFVESEWLKKKKKKSQLLSTTMKKKLLSQ